MNTLIKKMFLLVLSMTLLLGTMTYAEDANQHYIPVSWNQLIPADYDLDELENELISRYDIDNIQPDSLEADTLIEQLQQLQFNAPMTHEYDNTQIKIPGFIVPLDFDNDKITSFLLVPYFGACIHTPPPPPNQIVYVILKQGIQIENTYEPVYVNGLMRVESQDSELGASGYTLYGDSIEPYI